MAASGPEAINQSLLFLPARAEKRLGLHWNVRGRWTFASAGFVSTGLGGWLGNDGVRGWVGGGWVGRGWWDAFQKKLTDFSAKCGTVIFIWKTRVAVKNPDKTPGSIFSYLTPDVPNFFDARPVPKHLPSSSSTRSMLWAGAAAMAASGAAATMSARTRWISC